MDIMSISAFNHKKTNTKRLGFPQDKRLRLQYLYFVYQTEPGVGWQGKVWGGPQF